MIEKIQESFAAYLRKTFNIDDIQAINCQFALNVDDQKQQFGDLNSNAPMIIAKLLGKNPRTIAQQMIDEFKHPSLEHIEIAGPGFLNATITLEAAQELAQEIITQQEQFFKLSTCKPRFKYSIEFVSANPTGPLHFGHGRGGIVGDVLGNILTFIGHQVVKEFYINDAGSQMNKLGVSLKVRCQQLVGIKVDLLKMHIMVNIC